MTNAEQEAIELLCASSTKVRLHAMSDLLNTVREDIG